MSLSGGKLAGGNPEGGRVENDFYATNPKAVTMLLEKYNILKTGNKVLEPCCGMGHISKTVEKYYGIDVDKIDLVDRGCGAIIDDFLTHSFDNQYDTIITNPPYSLALEFIEKSLDIVNPNGVVAMFLKIQFLEGQKRKEFFESNPPKYIYVFRNRMATWNNGEELDPNGKRWATTMCHAWFIWEKGSKTEPIVRWL